MKAQGTRTHWKLFSDESGDFKELGDSVLAAGLLLRSDAPRGRIGGIKGLFA